MTPDMALGLILGGLLTLVLLALSAAVLAIVDYDNRERAERLSSRAIETQDATGELTPIGGAR